MSRARHVSGRREVHRGIFWGGGRPEGKRPLGSAGGRCENNIKLGLKEIKWDGVEWVHLAEDWDTWRAIVNAVMNLRVE
jgi:hypothetical protein